MPSIKKGEKWRKSFQKAEDAKESNKKWEGCWGCCSCGHDHPVGREVVEVKAWGIVPRTVRLGRKYPFHDQLCMPVLPTKGKAQKYLNACVSIGTEGQIIPVTISYSLPITNSKRKNK